MHVFYIVSSDVHVFHGNRKPLSTVAVYDRSLLAPLIRGLHLKGTPNDVANARLAIDTFLTFWEGGQDKVSVKVGGFSLTVYSTGYIEQEDGMVTLGERPIDPFNDLMYAMRRTATAMEYNQADVAKRYQQLQQLMEQNPTLPQIKERV